MNSPKRACRIHAVSAPSARAEQKISTITTSRRSTSATSFRHRQIYHSGELSWQLRLESRTMPNAEAADSGFKYRL
jgi:hypothetical protein